MPKMIEGRIACRISYAPDYAGKKFYCDFCGEMFDHRHEPPCEKIEERRHVEGTIQGIVDALDKRTEIMTNAMEAIGEKKVVVETKGRKKR